MKYKTSKDYWLGKEAYNNGEFKKAKEHFIKLLEGGVDFADVYYMLGIIYHRDGKYESAVHCFEEALSINPDYTEASLNLAVIYNDMGKIDRAGEVYANAKSRAKIETKPKYLDNYLSGKISNLHADLADIYHSIGVFDTAIHEYEMALNLNPDFHDIRTKLAMAMMDAGKVSNAVVELKKVIKERPGFTPASMNLGLCYFKMNKFNEARKIWEEVAKDDPDNKFIPLYLKMLES